MNRVLPYLWYPLLFGAAIALFATLRAGGAHLLLALYLPVALAGLAIVVLERCAPERPDWRPRWNDVKADAMFLSLVQIALPRALAALLALGAAQWSHAHAASRWWPHALPLAVQAILMVLAVDFLRYWLHRACHRFALLWRLHEVHHSPDMLYALNTGRFHPLEKLLHFSADTVPFVLLGVAPEVMAAYFLIYAVNGLFQHSSARLRHGWLNHLVGSAETHRWHHARDPKTASCNFGSTTLVWDLVFGTWSLPKGRPLDVGIPDRHYPKGFWAQMGAPFRRHGARRSARVRMADLLIALMLRWTRLVHHHKVARAARDPMRAQQAVLREIVRTNRGTTFGRAHGFEAMRGYEDFIARVPVAEYEALRPHVQAQIQHGEKALTHEAPVQHLRTSGTTGQPKDVPLTPSHLKRLRRIHRESVAAQHRTCPQAFVGSVLVITSPAVEGMLANGTPFGSASGVVAGSTPALVQEKFVVPSQVFTIADSRVKYLLILRLALARSDISYIGSANASTLLALIKLYHEHEVELISSLRRGGFFLAREVPQELLGSLGERLRADPARADELQRLQVRGGVRRIADLWPQLRMVVTWTCASAGVAANALRSELSPRTRVQELGFVASEFRATITLGRQRGSGLPTFDSHFFEFVERDRWDRGEPEFLTLGQIRKGVDYYLIVTTPSGLYRYFINDLVCVSGFLKRMPLLRFVQKGKGVTNITGEKLYESQVLAAVQHAMAQLGSTARFMMMRADEQALVYRLYVEAESGQMPSACTLAERVDAQLQVLNIEYRAKRESGRLGALSAAWLVPGTEAAFKRESVCQGQREGQFKVVALGYQNPSAFDLERYTQRR